MKEHGLKGILAALVPNVIFGFSFLFSKIALDYAHPLMILAIRFTVAFAVLNILWLCKVIHLDFKGKDKKRLIMMSLAQPLLYFIMELYGINLTSSAMSGVLISLVPVGVIILSILVLKERPTNRQIFFSMLSLAAVIAITLASGNSGSNTLLGILLLMVAVFCASLFNILSRAESKRFSPVERTYMMFFIGTIGFNIIALVGLNANYVTELTRAVTSLPFWGAISYLSILSSIVAFMLYNYATTLISPVRAASFANITTVVSVFAGIFIMGETLTIVQLICCVFIIIGVLGGNKE